MSSQAMAIRYTNLLPFILVYSEIGVTYPDASFGAESRIGVP